MTEQQPFTIRAHHLMLDYNIFNVAVENPKGLESFISARTNQILEDYKDPTQLEYATDILGDNPADFIPTYKRRILEYATDFVKLPDSHPVHITNQKDRICTACAIGRHCDEDTSIGFESPYDVVETEHLMMRDFIRVARWLGLEEGKDFLSVMDDRHIIRIEATKKVVGDVVRTTDRYFDSLPK